MLADWGADSSDTLSYGKDVLKPNTLRVNDYGNVIGQGVATKTVLFDGSISYLINTRNNFNFVAGFKSRTQTVEYIDTQSIFFYVGIRTSLKNLYADF